MIPLTYKGVSAHIDASVVDQQAFLFGHTCFNKGEAEITYRTSGILLLNTGNKRMKLNNNISITITAQYDENINYTIDGDVYCVASCISWLINELKIVSNPKEIDKMEFNVDDSCSTYFIPSMTGISAPYWKFDLNGAFFGLLLNSKRKDIVRAVHKSIAYRF